MRKIPRYIFILIFLVCITNCDEEFINREFPSVLTGEALIEDDGSVILNGNLILRGVSEIDEYGFIWQSNEDPMVSPGFKYAIPENTSKGGFSYIINNSLNKNTLYYFRAYAITGGFKVFGVLNQFLSTNEFELPVFHLSQVTGQAGDTVMLKGSGFNSGLNRNMVKFGNIESEITSISDSTIECIVPLTLVTAETTVTVISDGSAGAVAEKFKLTKPVITGFSPSEVQYNDTLEIYGTGFHKIKNLNSAYLGETMVEILESSNTKLRVVNTSTTDTLCNISVTVSGQSTTSSTKLILQPPDFILFSPDSGKYLDIIVISYKSIDPGSIKSVWFGDFQGRITSITETSIGVEVPISLNTLESSIKINYGNTSFTFSKKFTLESPHVTSLSVNNIQNMSSLTVYGTNFSTEPLLNRLALKNSATNVIYYLDPTSSTTTSFNVTVYNHSTGNHLPSGSYAVGIKTPQATIWSDALLTITDIWRRLTDFPGGERYKGAAFSVNGFGYCGLGVKIGNDMQKDLWKFDPQSEGWTRMSDFPGYGRIYPFVFQNSSSGFVGGGQSMDNTASQVPYTDFYKYNPTLNNWEKLSDALNVEKSYPGGSASPTEIIHIANISTSSITEYNSLLNTWSETYFGPAATNRDPYTFSISGKVYFVGGINNALTNGTNNQVWEYDPVSETITRKNDFPGTSSYGGFSFTIGKYGYIGCGVNWIYSSSSLTYLNQVYRYDPETDTWTEIATYPGGNLLVPVSFVIGNKAYIMTGYNQTSLLKTVWEFFDPINR